MEMATLIVLPALSGRYGYRQTGTQPGYQCGIPLFRIGGPVGDWHERTYLLMRDLPVLALPALLERHLSGYVKTKGTGVVIDVKTQLMVASNIIAHPAGSGSAAVPG